MVQLTKVEAEEEFVCVNCGQKGHKNHFMCKWNSMKFHVCCAVSDPRYTVKDHVEDDILGNFRSVGQIAEFKQVTVEENIDCKARRRCLVLKGYVVDSHRHGKEGYYHPCCFMGNNCLCWNENARNDTEANRSTSLH